MSTMQEALMEAYAAAPVSQVVLSTLELRHTTFPAPIRLLRDYGELFSEGTGGQPDIYGRNLTLEADAPVQPSATVFFQSCMFDFKLPEQQEARVTGLEITIDNATKLLSEHLDAVVAVRDPLYCMYREYFADDTTQPQFIISNLSLTSVRSNVFHVRGVAEFVDLVNRKFPNKIYRPEEYRGLVV